MANDDQSTGNVPGNNATLNLLTNDAVADGTQATVGNTSVTLIDPATGFTNGYTKCCYDCRPGCIYLQSGNRCVNLWSKSWLYYRSCTYQLYPYRDIDGFEWSGECCDYQWNSSCCQRWSKFGQCTRQQRYCKPIDQWRFIRWFSGNLEQYHSNLDRSCYRFSYVNTKCSDHSWPGRIYLQSC